MSGTSLAVRSLDPVVQSEHSTAFSDVSSSTSDPSTLRAAALMTLKSKRRKQPSIQPLAPTFSHRPPPPAESVVHLDYGQDETAMSVSPHPTTSTPVLPVLQTTQGDMEDGQIREEGEISDEEISTPTIPIPKSPKVALQPSIGPVSPPRPTTASPASPSRMPFPKFESPSPSMFNRIRPSPHARSAHRESLGQQLVEEEIRQIRRMLSQIDTDHIRPGLAMNQEQYDNSKGILLDLLGWGVSPEYLVESEISPLFLFYAFNELNLRFPRNLDITQFTPYPPIPELLDYPTLYPAFHSSRQPQLDGSQAAPPAESSSSRSTPPDDTAETLSQSRTPTSPNLPFAAQQRESQSRSLDGIEQQRKQELLARKAAQDSRRLKQTTLPSAPHAGDGLEEYNSADSSLVPSETVDDFLNAITHGPVLSTTQTVVVVEQEETMDIDEVQESNFSEVFASPEPTKSPSPGLEFAASPASALNEGLGSTSPSDVIPSTSLDVITSEDTTLQLHPPPANRSLPRRGIKRPVASDFVDLESFPQDADPRKKGPSNGVFKAFHSFAPINTMRRCVIDLSDEEEDDEIPPTTPSAPPRFSDMERDRRPARLRGGPLSVRPASSTSTTITRRPTPTTPTGASNVGLTPAALAAKELEIQRMRALIAEKERNNHLKKLAAVKTASQFPSSDTSESLPTPGAKLRASDTWQIRPAPTTTYTPSPHNVTSIDRPSLILTSPNLSKLSPQAPVIGPPFQSSARRIPADSFDAPCLYGPDDKHSNARPNADAINASTRLTPQEAPESATEERHEQVDSQVPTPTLLIDGRRDAMEVDEQVDVDQLTSASTQVGPLSPLLTREEQPNPANTTDIRKQKSDFEAYNSLLAWYPLLRSRSGVSSTPASSSLAYSSATGGYTHTRDIISLIDFKALRLQAMLMHTDPSKQLCRYEVPGGGECRDDKCEDVHLSKMGFGGGDAVVPSDEATASYLMEMLPSAWLQEYGITCTRIIDALEQERNKDLTIGFEDYVTLALYDIGRPPPT